MLRKSLFISFMVLLTSLTVAVFEDEMSVRDNYLKSAQAHPGQSVWVQTSPAETTIDNMVEIVKRFPACFSKCLHIG